MITFNLTRNNIVKMLIQKVNLHWPKTPRSAQTLCSASPTSCKPPQLQRLNENIQKHEIQTSLAKSEGIGRDPVGQDLIFRHKLVMKMGFKNFNTSEKRRSTSGYDHVSCSGEWNDLILTVDLYSLLSLKPLDQIVYSYKVWTAKIR